MTNKYTRTFADFNNHPWPGKILPQEFEQIANAGDGYMGMQGMIQGAMSAYGPYHVIEGCEYVSPEVATEWTGGEGYVMYSGIIESVPAASGDLSAVGSYLIYNADGTFDTTGAEATGVILAQNIGGTVYTTRSRYDTNSKLYIPNDLIVYGDILGIDTNVVSGYESIIANTGQFKHITGFSNVHVDSHLDFGDNYNISGVVQLSGSLVRVNTANGLTVGAVTLEQVEWEQLNNIDSAEISSAEWGFIASMNQAVHSDADPTFDTLSLDAAGLTVGTKTLTDLEWAQLANINSSEISSTEWGHVAGMQAVGTSADVTFDTLDLDAGGLTVGTRTLTDGEWTQLTNIGANTIGSTQWSRVAGMQAVATSSNPTFGALTLNTSLNMTNGAISNIATIAGNSTDIGVNNDFDMNDNDIKDIKSIAFNDGGTIDVFRDQDDMSSNDPNAAASQQSIKVYSDERVTNIAIYQSATLTDSGGVSNPSNINDGNTGTISLYDAATDWVVLTFKKALWINDFRFYQDGGHPGGEISDLDFQVLLGDGSTWETIATFDCLNTGSGTWLSWVAVNKMTTAIRIYCSSYNILAGAAEFELR
jgi:hypothetical protein